MVASHQSFRSYGLAIHTASADLGLAVSNFAGDNRQQVYPDLGRQLSTHLQVYLDDFLTPQTWNDLAFIAVAQGPGGFTGTRLGVVTARTLAQALEIPLFAVSTLAAVAWMEWATHPAFTQDLAVQIAAHRGEWYTAIYAIEPSTQEGHPPRLMTRRADAVLSADQWQQTIEQWQHPIRLLHMSGGLGRTAPSLLELAYLDWQQGNRPHWSEALPFYGQSPV